MVVVFVCFLLKSYHELKLEMSTGGLMCVKSDQAIITVTLLLIAGDTRNRYCNSLKDYLSKHLSSQDQYSLFLLAKLH